MSALAIAIARLKQVTGVTSVVTATKIYAMLAPQTVPAPYVLVNLISEPDEPMLDGAGRYYESRVSIEAIGTTGAEANSLGEAIKGIDVVKASIAGCTDVDIWKADSDYSDYADDRTAFRRTMDFYIRWR